MTSQPLQDATANRIRVMTPRYHVGESVGYPIFDADRRELADPSIEDGARWVD